ncbi:MAG TPA: PH domain-containing protein [Allosphingosinicella sp.]|jgi:membrane protein YdbS with pleckstrin-like domain
MAGDVPTMKPLDPAQLSVLRVRSAIVALVLIVPILLLDFARPQGAVPAGLPSGAAALLLAVWTALGPRRRYRSWGFAMEEDELHVQHGLLTRVRTIVPFGRVQHIDVQQGPIERRYGLGTLVLHTAGTRSSAVGLPGLPFEEAGRMRDIIRAKIRQDLL